MASRTPPPRPGRPPANPWPSYPSSNSPTPACAPSPSRSSASTTPCARLIDDMFETMYEAPGIGLAATQVDVHQRLLVLDVSEDKSRPMVFINPEITASSGQPGLPGRLPVGARHLRRRHPRQRDHRHAPSTATASPSRSSADGLLAVCIQHEMDHLAGKVFVDYLSPLKREHGAQEAGQAAPPRRRRRRGLMACGSFSPARRSSRCRACAPPRVPRRRRRRLHPARPAGRPRPPADAVAGQARGAGARRAGVAAGELQDVRGQRRAARARSPT